MGAMDKMREAAMSVAGPGVGWLVVLVAPDETGGSTIQVASNIEPDDAKDVLTDLVSQIETTAPQIVRRQ